MRAQGCRSSMRRVAYSISITLLLVTTANCSNLEFNAVNARNVFKDPKVAALAGAGCDGNTKKMETLVKEGVDVNATGTKHGTVLMWVLFCKNVVGFTKLLELGANPNYSPGSIDPVTWVAAGANEPKWLRIVLAHGGDPNIMASGDRSALIVAEEYGRTENMHMLINSGADVNAKIGGFTIANYLVSDHKYDMLIYVLNHGYRHNLTLLAQMIDYQVSHERFPISDKEKADISKIKEMLNNLGVKYPVPPLGQHVRKSN